MAIIEVPDISIVKTVNGSKQLLSLRDQKIKKDGVLNTFGVGSGIKNNGDLYVLGNEDVVIPEDVILKMEATTKLSNIGPLYIIPKNSSSSKEYYVDWGDGSIEFFNSISLYTSHNYEDGLNSHDIRLYTNSLIQSIECKNCGLTNLNINNCTELVIIKCDGNNLSNLMLNNLLMLANIYCSNNQITTLDISNNTNLLTLECGSNKLKSLNVEHNTKLQTLYFQNNDLSTLSVSNNSEIKSIKCDHNPLSETQYRLTTLANSLPNRTGISKGLITINKSAESWIDDICTSKNWSVYFVLD